jgi:multidrug efflux pump
MTGIIDWAVARSRTVLSLLAVCLLAGSISYVAIPKEANPDIPIPIFFVSLSLPGVSPEDGERLLLRPAETRLQTIEGVKEMRSYAALGHAGIILEFDVNFDKDKALQDVRDKLDEIRAELPEDANEPVVREFNTSLNPVIIVALSGDVPQRTLYRLARQLKDEIESVPTVLEATIAGRRSDLLEVIIDPAKLETYNISQRELINAVQLNNRLVAAGQIDTGQGRFAVKVPGLFETSEDVLSLPIRASTDGIVTLGDVADIRRTFTDPSGYARLNGRPAVALQVTKRIGTNIIETNQAVRAIVDRASAELPESVHVDYMLDASKWIYRSLNQLQSAIMTAIILVMIVVVAVLGLRSAILVGIAIPSSFLIGFFLLNITGMTVNMMVMFGMVLSVGLLVDGAIVVTEYADRKMAEGQHRKQAYAMAAKRMFWPITSATATTLAAFAPMLLWPGVTGKFMSFFPITLIYVLGASLLVALIFLPVLGSVFGKAQPGNENTMKALAASEGGDLRDVGGLTGRYIRIIERLIRRPLLVILAAVVILLSIVISFAMNSKGVEFFVETEPEFLTVFIRGRGNLSADESRDLVIDVERRVSKIDGIQTIYTRTSTPQSRDGGGFGGAAPTDQIGRLWIQLKEWEDRRPGREIVRDIRQAISDLPGIFAEVRLDEQGPPTGKDVQVELSSMNYAALRDAATRLRAFMENEIEGLIEVDDTRPLPGIEWELTVDREQAGRFGADIASIGSTVQLITNGILIGRYRPDDADDEVDIRARFPSGERGIEALDNLRVQTAQGLVPISNFVERRPQQLVNQIDRVNGRRIMTVRANVAQGYLANNKINTIREWIENERPFDHSVQVRYPGGREQQEESEQFLVMAMGGALFLMAIILLTQFNNFYHAGLILSSIVLSTVGVLLGMLVTGQKFSVIMTGTGIVALAGIVVNNNIVLIDTYQRLLATGFSGLDAILRTAAQRARPVLLTTVTTICGLLPMVFQLNVDYAGRSVSIGGPVSAWWVQLATAVVFGLGFSTFVTLFLTPTLLAAPIIWSESIGRRWRAAKRRLGFDAPEPQAAE